jgi:integrase
MSMGYVNGLKLIGKKWHYRFRFHGQLLRGSTELSSFNAAREWLQRYKVKLINEGVGIREMPTLRQLHDEWAQTASATNQPGQITSMHASIYTHCKHLLDRPIDQLTTECIKATFKLYLATKGSGPGRQGHTKGGANALRLRLNTLMGYAIRCGYIHKKPYDVDKFKIQQKPRPVVRTTKAKDFLEALDRLGRSEDRKLAICLMFGLGVRESEALGLRWEFVNFDQGCTWVGRLQDGAFITKGGEARSLNIPGWLLERLRDRWMEDKEPTNGLILPGPLNKITKAREPHSPGYTAPLVKRVGGEIGLPGLTPHRMRASFISALVLEAKVSLPQAQRMAGHKHIATTMKYVEGLDDHREAMGDLERLQNLDGAQNRNGS